jgi:hypothetical protein
MVAPADKQLAPAKIQSVTMLASGSIGQILADQAYARKPVRSVAGLRSMRFPPRVRGRGGGVGAYPGASTGSRRVTPRTRPIPRVTRSRGCRRLLCVGCARWGAWRSAPTRARRGRLAPMPIAQRTRGLLPVRGQHVGRMEASRSSVDATFRGPLTYASSTHRRHALAYRATGGCWCSWCSDDCSPGQAAACRGPGPLYRPAASEGISGLFEPVCGV